MGHGEALAALADPTRRAAFELLRGGALAVGEIADRMPVSRPAVSQHLRVLKDAGLVNERRAGTRRLYAVEPDGVAELRAYLDDMWDGALDAFERTANKQAKGSRSGDRRGRR
jgi:DNA-binding transcriptional ArsR family regulator